MPNYVDLNTAIRRLVSDEVNAALKPYQSTLNRLTGLFGARRGPGRPPKMDNALLGLRRGRRPNGATAQDRGDASKFKEGQKVSIRVGRGSDTGVVTKVDVASGSVWVKRDNGKGAAVKRPARGVDLQ